MWPGNWWKKLGMGGPGPRQSIGVQFDLTLEGVSDIGSRSRTLRWQHEGPIKVTISDLSGNSNVQSALIGSQTSRFKLTILRQSVASNAQQTFPDF